MKISEVSRGVVIHEYKGGQLLPLRSMAAILSSSHHRCRVSDIQDAISSQRVPTTTFMPRYNFLRRHKATFVSELPRIVEGLKTIKNADGTPRYPWAQKEVPIFSEGETTRLQISSAKIVVFDASEI